MRALFPGSAQIDRRFEVRFVELTERVQASFSPALSVTAYNADHASGAPAYSLRLRCAGKDIAYSGDTAWTEALLDVAEEADLFICEAYTYDKAVRFHLSYMTVAQQRQRLTCRRMILTHLGREILDHLDQVDAEIAKDGQLLSICPKQSVSSLRDAV